MSHQLGIIAEDETDVRVVAVILRKLITPNYGIRRFVGHGCGKIRGKCHAWTAALKRKGCDALILIHDLDEEVVTDLRQTLEQALHPSPIARYVIVIPIRELEAWLLADHEAIRRALNSQKTINRIANPQAIRRPKEHLRDLVERVTGRPLYISTIHNVRIAERIGIPNLRRCTSFVPFETFIREHFR